MLRVSSHLVASSTAQQPRPSAGPAQEQGVGGSQIFGYWPESLLLHQEPRRDAVLAEWRRRRHAAAAAMYPAGMGHTRDEMPCLWTQQEWAEAEAAQGAEPIFDRREYDRQMCVCVRPPSPPTPTPTHPTPPPPHHPHTYPPAPPFEFPHWFPYTKLKRRVAQDRPEREI